MERGAEDTVDTMALFRASQVLGRDISNGSLSMGTWHAYTALQQSAVTGLFSGR